MRRKKRNGTWKNLEFALEQAQQFLKEHPEHETLPRGDILRRLGYSSLNSAISKYHGGYDEFRKLLGESSTTLKHSSWKSLEFTLEKAKEFLNEHPEYETLPRQATLCQLGYSSLNNAISKYHGGYHKFRKLLGENSTRSKQGSWKSLEFTLEKAKEFLNEHPEYETLPRQAILCQLKYSSLSKAIINYHGGFPAFRETLRQYMTGKTTKQELEDLLESYVGDD